MKLKLALLIFIGCTMNAQNLVQNPSFEIKSSCFFSFGQIYVATGWSIPSNTSNASPDYFNPCQVEGLLRVPANLFGVQQAFEGNAYAGIVTYYTNTPVNYREYLQTHLLSPLIAGHEYIVSYYVSPADYHKWSSNNINAVLTEQPLVGDGTVLPLNITPQIINQNVVNNTSEWTLISGTYQAVGNEKYLTIGNFSDNSSTQVEVSNPNATTNNQHQAYYYIDNVSVIQSSLNNDEFEKQKIIISPNPVTDNFSITYNKYDSIKNIEIYSQFAKLKVFNVNDNVFFIEDLASGIYFLTITFDTGEKITTKIIKI